MKSSAMMLKFALRNLLRQKGRTAMTLAAIIIGVMGLILSGGFVEDIFIQLREATIHSRLGHFQIYRQGYLENWSKDPGNHLMPDPAEVQSTISEVPGVLDSMQRVNFFGLVNNGRSDLPVLAEGVEPAKEAAQFGDFFFVVEGRMLLGEERHKLLLGEGVARALKLKPGALVNVLANMPDGGLNSLEFEVVGIFRTFSKEFDARAVRMNLVDARELLAVEGAHAIVVSLKDTLATDASAAQARAALAGKGFEIKTWFELDDFYRNTVDLYESQFGVLQAVILIVVLLSVANSVNMTAQERVGEFGTLMALGLRQRDVARLIVLENTLLGLVGASAGVLLGIAVAWGISQTGIPMPPPPNSNAGYTALIRIVPEVLAVSFLIGLVATVVSALFAARSAARVPVVEALRQNI
jgi:putative ABC transport system permease protein